MSRPELADCTVLWVAPQSDMTKPCFSSNDNVVSAFSDASKHWPHTRAHGTYLEAHGALEVLVDGAIVFAGPGVIDAVVAAHHRRDAGVDGGLEGRVVDLPLHHHAVKGRVR